MKKIVGLVFFLLLLFGLILASRLVKQRQETRKSAAGTGLVKFTLQLTNTTGKSITETSPESILRAQIILDNPQNLLMKTAGAEISFNPDVFTASNLECDPALPIQLPISQITPDLIKLTCYQPLAQNLSAPVALGSFVLSVLKKAPLGQTQLTFTRTRAPENETNTDLADNGTPLNLAIVASPTLPPTPTNQPFPPVSPTTFAPKPVCMKEGSPCKTHTSCCSKFCSQGYCAKEQVEF